MASVSITTYSSTIHYTVSSHIGPFTVTAAISNALNQHISWPHCDINEDHLAPLGQHSDTAWDNLTPLGNSIGNTWAPLANTALRTHTQKLHHAHSALRKLCTALFTAKPPPAKFLL